MISWSLEAFVDPGDGPPDVDVVAKSIVDLANSKDVLVEDALCPFSGERLGGRLDWPDWWVKVMTRHGPDVMADAAAIAKSRAAPAATRHRLLTCNRAVRVIFGPDDARLFTDTIIDIAEF